jgi:LCP family protein required for cell wall assembly
MKKEKKKKSIASKFTKAFVIISVIGIMIWGGIYALNYYLGEDTVLNSDGTVSNITTPKKKIINALICGTNQTLSDTMIFVRYNVETGKIAMMSIPRDTYVDNEYCIGHKLNAIYRGKNAIPLVKQIEDLLSVDIDYYLIFDSTMLIDMVDAVGGVEINVPIKMKYDDYTQNLHIDLKPGVQVLNGKQAEQFVRFRKGNDGGGYTMGDLERTSVQQTFIKSFIATILSASNITKIPSLINIALKNTDTNVTAREALRYSTDAIKINTENIVSYTAPGEPKYIDELSYFILDKDKAKAIIEKEFSGENTTDTTTTVTQ